MIFFLSLFLMFHSSIFTYLYFFSFFPVFPCKIQVGAYFMFQTVFRGGGAKLQVCWDIPPPWQEKNQIWIQYFLFFSQTKNDDEENYFLCAFKAGFRYAEMKPSPKVEINMNHKKKEFFTFIIEIVSTKVSMNLIINLRLIIHICNFRPF